MCKYFSCIVTPDFKVHWSITTNSHDELMEQQKIREKYEYKGLAVKIEVLPQTTPPTRNPEDWRIVIDTETPPPEWFINAKDMIESSIWEAWKDSTTKQLVIDTETLTVKKGFVYACGSATVDACGSATVDAHDSAKVNAHDSATVYACGSATVYAYDSATVKLLSELVVVRKNGKLYILLSAQVQKVLEVN